MAVRNKTQAGHTQIANNHNFIRRIFAQLI
jgi:hypothetical protein